MNNEWITKAQQKALDVRGKMSLTMEESLYLTKELKNYYIIDFNALLSYQGSAYWDIDEGLVDILKQINLNPGIQTLFSKRYIPSSEYISTETISYLEFTYTKELEKEIIFRLTKLKADFICKNSILDFCLKEPSTNDSNESNILLGCRKNPNYFMFKHIRIELDSQYKQCHDLFWEKINESLSVF